MPGGVLVVTTHNANAYLLALPHMQQESLPAEAQGSVYLASWTSQLISPDRHKLAYVEWRSPGSRLHIVSSNGQPVSVGALPEDQLWVAIGWLTDQRLALVEESRPQGTTVVLNLPTGQTEELAPSFPAVTSNGSIWPLEVENGIPYAVYNSAQTRTVVYRRRFSQQNPEQDRSNYELWDTASERMLWEARTEGYYDYRTVWSPNGEHFAIIYHDYQAPTNPNAPSASMYLVDTSGQQRLLADRVAGNLSWSPDGSRIAAWSVDPNHRDHPSPLVIVDLNGKELTVFRLSNGYTPIDQYPLWSPDGQWIAFNGYVGSTMPEDGELTQVIVLNVAQQRAFVLADGMIVKGWMAPVP